MFVIKCYSTAILEEENRDQIKNSQKAVISSLSERTWRNINILKTRLLIFISIARISNNKYSNCSILGLYQWPQKGACLALENNF